MCGGGVWGPPMMRLKFGCEKKAEEKNYAKLSKKKSKLKYQS